MTVEHHIVVDEQTTNQYQQYLTSLENLYRARYCSDRPKQWHETYSAGGDFIPENERKPYFEGGLPKKIIDTFTSELFGLNKFPSAKITAKPSLYANKIIQNDQGILGRFITDDNIALVDQNNDNVISEEEVERHLISNSQRLAEECMNKIIENSFIKLEMLKASRKAFMMGKSFLAFKVSGGDFYLQIKDRRWIKNVTYDKKQPHKIVSFREEYVYQGTDQQGKPKRYIHRCDYDTVSERTYFPVEFKGWNESYRWVVNENETTYHNLGFCPAVALRCEDDIGILDDQIDNLLSYMYVGSDAYRGVKANMDPQWALTLEKGQTANIQPRVKGNIWAFEGKGIQAISVGVGGYQEARNIKVDLKYEILEACRIQSVPVSNEQSAEAIRIRMKPQSDAVGEFRVLFGDRALVELLTMMMQATIILSKNGHILSVAGECLVPDDENGFKVKLVWPQIETVTVDMMYQAVQMVAMAIPKDSSVLTEDAAIDILALFLPIQNIEQMKRELSKRRMDQSRESKDVFALEIANMVLGILTQKKQLEEGVPDPVTNEPTVTTDEDLEEMAEKVLSIMRNNVKVVEKEVESEEDEDEKEEKDEETDDEEE